VVKQRRPAVVVTSFKLKALLAGGSDLILLLTSMFCVAGSTTIGNRVMMSGQTGIKDHVTICDDVVLVHRAGVTADIDQPGAYAGLPVQPLKDYMRNTAESHMLADLRQRVLTLERPDGTPVP